MYVAAIGTNATRNHLVVVEMITNVPVTARTLAMNALMSSGSQLSTASISLVSLQVEIP